MFRALLVILAMTAPAVAQDLPIFDAHIHYSHDAVVQVPPKEAADLLRAAGVRRALVSSSDDDGTQRLYAEAPDIVVPSLRPYRRRGDVSTWVNDPTILTYVEQRLAKYSYRAIGEFHAYGADIETPVVQRIIALAREHKLLLHAHSDADAIERIFKTDPAALVLWAHAGFDRPERVREVLRRHKNLWCDLAFRSDQGSGDSVDPEWQKAFEEFPDRFMVGTDTFTPERWHYVKDHAAYSRRWLSALPRPLAERIAYRNADEMLARVAPMPAATR
jgi:hypothetical protein